MSVTSQKIKQTYVSQGEIRYEIDFPFDDGSEIQVTSLNEEKLAEEELVHEVDYHVTSNTSKPGGYVVLTDSGLEKTPVANMLTVIKRPKFTQETVLTENDPFYTSTIEKMVDKLTYITQTLKADIERSVTYPIGLSYKPDYLELSETIEKAYTAAKDAAAAAIIINESKETATIAAQKSMAWASNPENVPVEDGKYSAYHYAMQIKNTNEFANLEEAVAGLSETKAISPFTAKISAARFASVDYSKNEYGNWGEINYASKSGILVCQCAYGRTPNGCMFYLEVSNNPQMEDSFSVITADCATTSMMDTFIIPISKGDYYRPMGGLSGKVVYFIPFKGEG